MHQTGHGPDPPYPTQPGQFQVDSGPRHRFYAPVAVLLSSYQLEKSFATRLLFRGLTFAVEDGDRIGLIGPNGAGKSTLLKIIAGRETPDGGELSRQKGLRVGYLEQTPTFPQGQSVYEAVRQSGDDPDDADHLMYVEEVLAKLELRSGAVSAEASVASLSGGWRKRVALARELVKRPDLLLLDEPTNHLDLESILWLEEFLQSARFATMTVTHDRLFLQRVANRIFDLDRRNPDGLLVVKGDYTDYLTAKEQLLDAQLRREQVVKNTLRRETEWLRRGAKARQTKQKARIERAGDLKDEVEELGERNLAKQAQIEFGGRDRSPKKLVEAKGVAKAYDGRVLFEDLDLLITPSTRLGLLGPNGAGKSTLIRVLLGQGPPDKGEIKRAEDIEVAYFEQHRETLDPKVSVLRAICPEGDYVRFQGQYIHVRSYLDRFLFRHEQAEQPVAQLSGGEQSRLRIAQLMLQEAHVLVLDEPTNDLDLATLNVLEESLRDFPGAVILVTHDRYFMDQVASELLAFGSEADDERRLTRFAGYAQWEAWQSERAKARAANKARKANADAAKLDVAPGAGAAPAAKKKKLSYKEKLELESMEGNIQAAEARLAELEGESQRPENLSDAAKLTAVFAEISELQAEIDRLYARWAELESGA